MNYRKESKYCWSPSSEKVFHSHNPHNNRSSNSSNPTSLPPLILKLAQPLGHSRHRSAFNIWASNKAPNTKQHRRQRNGYWAVLRESKVYHHRMTWLSSVHVRYKQLIDLKCPAVSAGTGAAQIIPLTQRQLPAKRCKQKWQEA